jgi:hypothetical protein
LPALSETFAMDAGAGVQSSGAAAAVVKAEAVAVKTEAVVASLHVMNASQAAPVAPPAAAVAAAAAAPSMSHDATQVKAAPYLVNGSGYGHGLALRGDADVPVGTTPGV